MIWWRQPRMPEWPMTIVGHGRVYNTNLGAKHQRMLAELAGTSPHEWGLLFILDVRQRHWTFYSPDPDYTEMFVPTASDLELTFEVFAMKFPCWNLGWRIE
jgi:hypothetical protein